VVLAVVQGGGGDPRVGSWTLTSAQGSETPANTLSVTPMKDSVHVVMSGETHVDFTAKNNGQGTSVPGNPGFNQVELHRMGSKQSEVKEMKDGAVVATVREKISNDGNELVVTTTRNGRPDEVSVWTRSGGVKVAHDPMAGEWAEDLGKSLMRQGTVVKIDADGNGGARYAGGYSYSARFDGKAYDVRNSRNDTVALALVDAHTVDSVFRRDDQVTQKDRSVVSADGQTMTVTTTATLENGQRLTEKLVFKKQ
jgi:hypothetical protein